MGAVWGAWERLCDVTRTMSFVRLCVSAWCVNCMRDGVGRDFVSTFLLSVVLTPLNEARRREGREGED